MCSHVFEKCLLSLSWLFVYSSFWLSTCIRFAPTSWSCVKFDIGDFIRVHWKNPDLFKTGHKCQAWYEKTWACLYCWQQCEIFCSSTVVWRNHCCISMATLNSSILLTLECDWALKGNALLCFHGNTCSIFILLTVTCCWTVPNSLMNFHGSSGYTYYSYIVYLVFVCFPFILSQPTLKLCFIRHHSLYFEIDVLAPLLTQSSQMNDLQCSVLM